MKCPRCNCEMTDLLGGDWKIRATDWTCLTAHDDLGREIHKWLGCRSCVDSAFEALSRTPEGGE